MTPRHPIIYIRGYAMTVAERNETAADPFCGFNIGSTVFRAQPDRQASPLKFVFESPLVRLVTEYQYHHVYQNGQDIVDPDWESPRDENGDPVNGISPASIIIHRYYDDGSEILGDGASRDVKVYAAKLNALILRVRELVLAYVPKDGVAMEPDAFKCYLVAHSMGGLVARAFLQNTADNYQLAQKTVDKLFTFATSHNGIDMLGLNVPHWLTPLQMNTFNRAGMKDYLNLGAPSEKFDGRVDLIPNSALASERIFYQRDAAGQRQRHRRLAGRVALAGRTGQATGGDGEFPERSKPARLAAAICQQAQSWARRQGQADAAAVVLMCSRTAQATRFSVPLDASRSICATVAASAACTGAWRSANSLASAA